MNNKIFLVLLAIVFVSGCAKTNVKEEAVSNCISECKASLEKSIDLSNGPCLSNEIVADWVCDVAHSPRQDIDNKPENQCSTFRERKAHHFVEVDVNCKLIKTW